MNESVMGSETHGGEYMMICFSVLGELSQSLFSIFKFKILQLDAVDVPHMTLMPSCILHCTTKTDLWISRDAKKKRPNCCAFTKNGQWQAQKLSSTHQRFSIHREHRRER